MKEKNTLLGRICVLSDKNKRLLARILLLFQLEITSFSKTKLLQRESFPTMCYTINSSPMLVTKSVFKVIFVLSNYQTCTFPLIKVHQEVFSWQVAHSYPTFVQMSTLCKARLVWTGGECIICESFEQSLFSLGLILKGKVHYCTVHEFTTMWIVHFVSPLPPPNCLIIQYSYTVFF